MSNKREEMLLDSGMIIGMIMGYSVEEWEEFLKEMEGRPGFIYIEHISSIIKLRKELTHGAAS